MVSDRLMIGLSSWISGLACRHRSTIAIWRISHGSLSLHLSLCNPSRLSSLMHLTFLSPPTSHILPSYLLLLFILSLLSSSIPYSLPLFSSFLGLGSLFDSSLLSEFFGFRLLLGFHFLAFLFLFVVLFLMLSNGCVNKVADTFEVRSGEGLSFL